MKICVIAPYFPYKQHIQGMEIEEGYNVGGVERHILHFSKQLVLLNHEITIISTRSPNHETLSEIEGLHIVRIPMGLRLFNSNIPINLLKKLNPRDYDVIHAHTPNPAIADMAVLRIFFTKIPFVLTYHNDITKDGVLGRMLTKMYHTTFGRLLFSHSKVIIATTESYAKKSPQLQNYLQKVIIIPNGVDCNDFKPVQNIQEIRKNYGLSPDKKIILFVGRLDSYKGCEYLLNSYDLVRKEIDGTQLIFIGKGPLENSLKKISEERGISGSVSFLGYVDDKDLPSYYALSDVFVLPSISSLEGFGMVQLEAMAAGKPVVTTTIPGVSEVDPDGLATIHVPPKDIQALSAAIIKILQNENLRITMGNNGRKLAIEKYSWENLAKSLERVYINVKG